HGGDIDDVTFLLCCHLRQHRLHRVVGAEDVDIHHIPEFILTGFKERGVSHDAGVVDQDVNGGECLIDGGDHAPDLFPAGYVAVRADDLHTVFVQFLHSIIKRFPAAADNGYIDAFVCQCVGCGKADATCAACNDCILAFDILHN